MSIVQSLFSTVTKTAEFVTSATSTTSSITIPSSSQVGDLCIITNSSSSNFTPPAVIPTGFTNVVNVSSANARMMTHWKILTSGDPGSTITGMSVSGWFSNLIYLIFRPKNFAISAVGTSIPSTEIQKSFPLGDQTIVFDKISEVGPVIPIIHVLSYDTGQQFNLTGGPTYSSVDSGNFDGLLYSILNQYKSATDSTFNFASPDQIQGMSSLTFTLY